MKITDIIVENVAGAVSTVAQPLFTERRTQSAPRVKTGKSSKKTYANSLRESAVAEAKLEEDDLIIVPGRHKQRKTGFIPREEDRTDHEVAMARSDLLAAYKNAKTVFELLKDRSEEEGIEGWVQEKLIKANDYLNAVREYYEEQALSSSTGGDDGGGECDCGPQCDCNPDFTGMFESLMQRGVVEEGAGYQGYKRTRVGNTKRRSREPGFTGAPGKFNKEGIRIGQDGHPVIKTKAYREWLRQQDSEDGEKKDVAEDCDCSGASELDGQFAGLLENDYRFNPADPRNLAKKKAHDNRMAAKAEREANKSAAMPMAPAAPKLTLDDVWREVEFVVGQVFPYGDPIDRLLPWFRKHGIADHKIGDYLVRAAKKNGYKDLYHYYDRMKDQYAGDNVVEATKASRTNNPKYFRIDGPQRLSHAMKDAIKKLGLPIEKQGYSDDSSTKWTMVVHNTKFTSAEQLETAIRGAMRDYQAYLNVSGYEFNEDVAEGLAENLDELIKKSKLDSILAKHAVEYPGIYRKPISDFAKLISSHPHDYHQRLDELIKKSKLDSILAKHAVKYSELYRKPISDFAKLILQKYDADLYKNKQGVAEGTVAEKAKSKQQQKFFGMVHALQKGDKIPGASAKLKKTARSMSKGDVTDFAKTSHRGLPTVVKKK